MSLDYRVHFHASEEFAELWHSLATRYVADDVIRFCRTVKVDVLMPYIAKAADAGRSQYSRDAGDVEIRTKATLPLRENLSRVLRQMRSRLRKEKSELAIFPADVFKAAVYALVDEQSASLLEIPGDPFVNLQVLGALPISRKVRIESGESEIDVARKVAAGLKIAIGDATFSVALVPAV